MTMPTRKFLPPDERIAPFLTRVCCLETGDAAALKRALGATLAQAKPSAQAAYFKVAPDDCKPWEENAFFLAACAACAFSKAEGAERSFIDCLRALYSESEGVEHLLLSLLDTQWDEDGYMAGKISRLLRRIKSQGMNVDVFRLTNDLLKWGSPSKSVQLYWSRAFYARDRKAQDADETVSDHEMPNSEASK